MRALNFHSIVEVGPSLRKMFLVFMFVYYPTDYFASLSPHKFIFTFTWEQNIPYIPEMYLVYYAIFALPLFTALIVDDKQQFLLISRRCIIATFTAGIFFVFVPTDSSLKKPNPDCFLETITGVVAGSHNYLPSLHVLLTLIFATGLLKKLGPKAITPIIVGTIILIASTLVTFQHQIVDIVASIAIYVPIVLLITEKEKSPR